MGSRALKRTLHVAMRGRPSSSPRVFAYHSVDDSGSFISVSEAELRMHLSVMRDAGFRGLTMAEFLERLENGVDPSQRELLLTFDDGYENFLTCAAPLLAEFGFPATVFVVTDLMGSTACWFDRDREAAERFLRGAYLSREELAQNRELWTQFASYRLLSWEQARALGRSGFDVHAHSAAHHFLTHLSDSDRQADFARARRALEDGLGRPADVLCYPYGVCDDAVVRDVRTAGFRAGFVADFGSTSGDPYRLPRVPVNGLLDAFDIRFALSAALDTHAAVEHRVDGTG